MSETIRLRIEPGGVITGLYAEALDWEALGDVQLRRASCVEPIPGEGNRWQVLMLPGEELFLVDEAGEPFRSRSAALAFEKRWLERKMFGS